MLFKIAVIGDALYGEEGRSKKPKPSGTKKEGH
jgi:hypothetical protein